MLASHHRFKNAQKFLHFTAKQSTTTYCLVPLCQLTRQQVNLNKTKTQDSGVEGS